MQSNIIKIEPVIWKKKTRCFKYLYSQAQDSNGESFYCSYFYFLGQLIRSYLLWRIYVIGKMKREVENCRKKRFGKMVMNLFPPLLETNVGVPSASTFYLTLQEAVCKIVLNSMVVWQIKIWGAQLHLIFR